MTAAVVKSTTDLEGSVAELSLASWTLEPWQPPHLAVASMVRQKTVRLHRLVDRHTIDRHE